MAQHRCSVAAGAGPSYWEVVISKLSILPRPLIINKINTAADNTHLLQRSCSYTTLPGPKGQVALRSSVSGVIIINIDINFSIINVDINIMNINKINISTIKINNNYISISVDINANIIIRNNIPTIKICYNSIAITIKINSINTYITNKISIIMTTNNYKITGITNIGTNNSSTKITNINKTAAPSTRCHQHQLAGAAAAQQLVAPTPALGAGGAPLRGEYTTKRAQRCCAPWCRW